MPAPGIEEIQNRYLAAGALLSAHLDLTHRCPLRCKHCYLGGKHQGEQELSLAEIYEIIDAIAKLGAFGLLFSGGEIFLRPDLIQIIQRARGQGFVVHLKTSGTGASMATLEAIATAGVTQVDVSFYSHQEAVHDLVTGVPGSFSRAMKLVHTLAPKLAVKGVVTLLRGFEENPVEVDQGLRALGVPAVLFNDLAQISCEGYPLEELWLPDSGKLEQWRHMVEGKLVSQKPGPNQPICKAGLTTLYISPIGEVRPCVEYPQSGGNIRTQTLEQIWKESPVFKQARSLRYGSMTACIGCPDQGLCQACPARSLKETGFAHEPAPSLCHRTSLWASILKEE